MAKSEPTPSNSPLAGEHSDRLRGECDLDSPVRLPLDDRIIELGRTFSALTEMGRHSFRQTLSDSDFDTLICFGQRAAALALQTCDSQWLIEGLTACAMMETSRIDPRDVASTPGLIQAIFRLLGVNPRISLENAATLAESRMAEVMRGLMDCSARERNVAAWLQHVVMTPNGPGLIGRDVCAYNPTVPLDIAILRIGQILRADQYTAQMQIGAELPDVWLSNVDQSLLAVALAKVVAGATIHADRRTNESDGTWNGIIVFLVETVDESAAKALLQLSRSKQSYANDFAMMATQRHRLFCLFIARNFWSGRQSYETNVSLQRFLPATEKALDDCFGA